MYISKQWSMHNHKYLWCTVYTRCTWSLFLLPKKLMENPRGPEPEIRCVTGEWTSARRHGHPRVMVLHAIRDLSDDGWLSTFALYQQLEFTVARSGRRYKPPFRACITVKTPSIPANLGRMSIRANTLAIGAHSGLVSNTSEDESVL